MINEDIMNKQKLHYKLGAKSNYRPSEINHIYGTDMSYQTPTTHEYPIGLPPQLHLSEAYKYFIRSISEGRQFKYFYKQLITLRRDILLDISKRNQGVVARDLHINPVKMSAIIAMLKEVDATQYHVTSIHA